MEVGHVDRRPVPGETERRERTWPKPRAPRDAA